MIRAAVALRAVKALHTAVWAVFAGAILAIPVVAWTGSLGWAACLIGLVLLEVAVLGCNHGRCPLTAVAARFTPDRAPNFDVFLPRALARWNKAVFGSIYLAAVLYTVWQWRRTQWP
jgi:hypothetical protein